MSEVNFKKDLEDSILKADHRLDKNDLLVDIFKMFVAKMLQVAMEKSNKENEGRLESDAVFIAKRELINSFRGASLGEYQQSEEWYEKLFQTAMEEIFNHASNSHKGEDQVSLASQNLEINTDAYINEGGLYVPSHMKR